MDSLIKYKIFRVCEIKQGNACMPIEKEGKKSVPATESLYRHSNTRSMSESPSKNDQASQRLRWNYLKFGKKVVKQLASLRN